MNSSAGRKKKNLKIQKSQKSLKNNTILLGVSGGVAAYKSIDLIRRLKEEGASVRVVMTEASRQFVTPLSLEVASQHRVYTSLFDDPLSHIRLPAEADLMIVAPATANIVAKFAHGIADDLLSTCFLAFRGRAVIAPSMNWRMYENPFFQENLKKLVSSGVIQVGPEAGGLACGEEGVGRMAEVRDIVEAVRAVLREKDLAGEKVLVTAGPTREYIDPVRFISNRSSGKMGFALARAARERGAEVTLVSGPSALKPPEGVRTMRVETAAEMSDAVMKEVPHATVLIMAAAVSDFRPVRRSEKKIDRRGGLSLELAGTADIIEAAAGSGRRPFLIGFAAETGRNLARAREKRKRKKLDMIVFNDVTEAGSGFDTDTNRVVIIDMEGEKQLELMSKDSVAHAVLNRYAEIRA